MTASLRLDPKRTLDVRQCEVGGNIVTVSVDGPPDDVEAYVRHYFTAWPFREYGTTMHHLFHGTEEYSRVVLVRWKM